MILIRTLLFVIAVIASTSVLAAPLICVSHLVSDPTFLATHAIDIFVKNDAPNTKVSGSDIRSVSFANPYPKSSGDARASFVPEGPACNGDWCDRIGDDEILVRSPQFSPDNTTGRHCFNVELPRHGKIEVDFSARKRVGSMWFTLCRGKAWILDDPTQGDGIIHFVWRTSWGCTTGYPRYLENLDL